MIYLTMFMTFIALVISVLYVRQLRGLKNLQRRIAEKRQINTNLRLTSKTYGPALDGVIQETDQVFSELQKMQITAQQEKATLDLAIHNITHDIRTPLTIANGHLYQLKKTILLPEQLQTVTSIENNLTTVANRLEVLLEYQDILENNINPTLIPLNLSQFCKEQLMLYYDAITRQNFVVTLSIADDLWIEHDPEVLERIVQNVFSNVLKHGQNNLTITLATSGKFAQLIIQNQPKQPIVNLNRLTSRFYSENMAESEDSSGLGLFIVQELTTLSHGYLELQAAANVFSVSLSWIRIQP